VWTKEELLEIARICLKHKVYIISDEIHADLIRPCRKHTVTASLSDEIADITITCTAPTKTFNLAGLQVANTFIKNPEIKKKVENEAMLSGYGHINNIGMEAAKAAYGRGGPWLADLLNYLEGNIAYLKNELAGIGARISLIEPEGTYLLWLDCRALGLSDEALDDFFVNKAKIWMNTGVSFGAAGSGFMRMNIACPKATLERAMAGLKYAVKSLK
jgi:cystathionine beta-lyase